MRMYLIRHSIKDESDPNDDDPGLTKQGRKIARDLAQWMVDKDEIPTVLYVSPKVRAQETAEIIRDTIEDAGLMAPDLKTDTTIGPDMSIRGRVLDVAKDKSKVRVGIVSHHESIEHGLRVLGLEPFIHLDIFAEGEMRIVKVKRKNGKWDEHRRILPSDLGRDDAY